MESSKKYELLHPVLKNTQSNFLQVDDLFKEAEDECQEKPYNYADRMMEKIESEYKKPSIEFNEREIEKKELNLKLGELKRKLHQSKNIRNVHKTALNQTLSEKRKKIRAEIETIKDKLYQLGIEEEGFNISSQKLVDATLEHQDK